MPDHPPVALITGASSGVGRHTALALAGRGYAVALLARRSDLLDETARMIREQDAHARVLVRPTDLADLDRLHEPVDEAVAQFGRLDVLANIAGDAPLQPIDQITPELWRQCVDVNLSATVLLTAAAWPQFTKQQSGMVLNMSSMASIDPFRGFNAYAAAKAGVNLFTHCTADEGQAINVRALAIALGAAETPALRRNFGPEVLPPEQVMSPEAVAGVLTEYITGKRPFDSGQTLTLTEL